MIVIIFCITLVRFSSGSHWPCIGDGEVNKYSKETKAHWSPLQDIQEHCLHQRDV